MTFTKRVILDFFAGGFADPPGDPPPIERDAPIALMEQAGFTIHVDRSIQRRFAGDATLPRSRYFTVCHTADGNDGGTLVNELTAYGQPLRSGPVDIIDTSVPSPEADHLRRYLRAGTAAVFFLVSESDIFPSPLHTVAGIDSAVRVGIVPLAITRVRLDRVIDLRVPSTADWFTREFTRLRNPSTGMPVFVTAGPLDEFADLLPALLAQDLGSGAGVTQLAGLWLRRLGADAVIFPSARSDLRVDVRNGTVIDSYGWNLVDYRRTPEPLMEIGFDLSPEWPAYPMVGANIALGAQGGDPFIYRGTRIARVPSGADRGSLTVRGIEEQRESLQRFLVWQYFVERLRHLIGDDADRLTQLVLRAAITSAGLMHTKIMIGLCHLFTSAALGDREARADVARMADDSESAGEVATAGALRRFLTAVRNR